MKKALRIIVKGVVQGVGFRPFIYQIAHKHNMTGSVLNSSEGVIIEVEGTQSDLDVFQADISKKAPPRSVIQSIDTEKIESLGVSDFTIKKSREKPEEFQLISPDISICDDCRSELFDVKDRRYRYPFINCTNCGPRFTIIKDIPYDRPKTTMKKFTMCDKCQAEYDDPMNRRFHAQPNACAVCGPEVRFVVRRSETKEETLAVGEEAIGKTVEALRRGDVVAIKGLGGFHLACDASSEEAVTKLRTRKRRYGKPLAIMVFDLERAEKLCYVNEQEKELLSSPVRPIVLLERKESDMIAGGVAPNNSYLGVMLPYTPLHYLLLHDTDLELVMTSGNLSEEPIAAENEEGLRRLGHIADSFLLHNRDIYSRYDDSVVRVVDGRTIMVRRARGYAPYPVTLPFSVEKEILAVGGELKSTFCLLKDRYAFVSQHIGDMENAETFEHYENTLELYEKLFRVKPEIVAYDMHPEYFTTKLALGIKGLKKVAVQHHHAHIASCLAEHGLYKNVIGVSFDGTGYGTDNTIWGGEFLVCDMKQFERVGYLRQVRLPGGEVAIKKPYRMAFSYLYSFLGDEYEELDIDFKKRLDAVEVEIMKNQVDKGLLSPLTSSAGRLFDAVSSLIGIRDEIDFEGQAAIEMEMTADKNVDSSYEFTVQSLERSNKDPEDRTVDSPLVVDTEKVIRGIIDDLIGDLPIPVMAAKFHNTVVALIVSVCKQLREKTGLDAVAISGGVFQNNLLTIKLIRELKAQSFDVIQHKEVPVNDGGISLGQAVIAYNQVLES